MLINIFKELTYNIYGISEYEDNYDIIEGIETTRYEEENSNIFITDDDYEYARELLKKREEINPLH